MRLDTLQEFPNEEAFFANSGKIYSVKAASLAGLTILVSFYRHWAGIRVWMDAIDCEGRVLDRHHINIFDSIDKLSTYLENFEFDLGDGLYDILESLKKDKKPTLANI